MHLKCVAKGSPIEGRRPMMALRGAQVGSLAFLLSFPRLLSLLPRSRELLPLKGQRILS